VLNTSANARRAALWVAEGERWGRGIVRKLLPVNDNGTAGTLPAWIQGLLQYGLGGFELPDILIYRRHPD
jgi:hypothetical protein